MEGKFGRVVPMKHGQAVQAGDGESLAVVGDETARLEESAERSQMAGDQPAD